MIITGISCRATRFNVVSWRRALAVLDTILYHIKCFISITATVAIDIKGAKGIVSFKESFLVISCGKIYKAAQKKLRIIIVKILGPKIRLKAPRSLASPSPIKRDERSKTKRARFSLKKPKPPLPKARIAMHRLSSSGIRRVLISSLEMRNKKYANMFLC